MSRGMAGHPLQSQGNLLRLCLPLRKRGSVWQTSLDFEGKMCHIQRQYPDSFVRGLRKLQILNRTQNNKGCCIRFGLWHKLSFSLGYMLQESQWFTRDLWQIRARGVGVLLSRPQTKSHGTELQHFRAISYLLQQTTIHHSQSFSLSPSPGSYSSSSSFFFFIFGLFRTTTAAYGGSQARDLIGAVSAGLHYSHSNTRSKPHLQPTPQLTAMLDP